VIRRILTFSLLVVVVLAGCHSVPKAGSDAAASQNFKVYKLRGKVVSTDAAKGEVTLNHEAIPASWTR